jgi:hypothetical protein
MSLLARQYIRRRNRWSSVKKGFLRDRLFALPKDLSTITTVLVLRRLPDLEGIPSAFKGNLGYATAVLTSLRSARGLNFFLGPLRALLSKLILLDKD